MVMRAFTVVPVLAAVLGALWPASASAQVTLRFAFSEVLTGDDQHPLRWPTAVAVGGDREIAVADAAGPSLVIFRDRGGAEGWVIHSTVELPAPAYSVSCGTDRYILSTRQPGVLLAVTSPDYELRELALASDITPGAATCLSDSAILVHDLSTGRMVVLDRDREAGVALEVTETVAALAPGPAGGFYAALPSVGEVRRYGANGEELQALRVPGLGPAPAWPVGLVVEADGEVVVADRHGGRILILEASGRWSGTGSRRGWEPGLLRFPSDLARFPDGRVVVADQGNGRVQIFRPLEP